MTADRREPKDHAGPGLVGVGIAACAACCAVPAFGIVTALVAGASVAALALGGILAALIVASLGVVLVTWRRRRRVLPVEAPVLAEPVPVVLQRPER